MDHLGSTRVILDDNGAVTGTYDNEPFGDPVAVTGVDTRKGFIDKENDEETETSNHSVRQYSPRSGRFISIDPLWEKFPSQTPYHYSFNNPVVLVDGNGKNPTGGAIAIGSGLAEAAIGSALVAAGIASAESIDRFFNGASYENLVCREDEVDYFLGHGSALELSNGKTMTIPLTAQLDEDVAWKVVLFIVAMEGGGDDPVEPVPPAPVPAEVPKNGETPHTVNGKLEHKNHDYGEGWDTKVRLPSGKRPDAVNWEEKKVIELKPNNPAKMKEFQKQLQGYIDELNKIDPDGGGWEGKIKTY